MIKKSYMKNKEKCFCQLKKGCVEGGNGQVKINSSKKVKATFYFRATKVESK